MGQKAYKMREVFHTNTNCFPVHSLIDKFSNKIQINKVKMASSSVLCQFLLISVFAIGTLLMTVPNVHALECYESVTKNASATSARGRALWEFNKIFAIANGNENPLSIGDEHPTKQCSAGYTFCATLHCTKLYGDNTVKSCAKMTGSQDPTWICQYLRAVCAGDPKFHCRFCNKDKCNDD